MVGDSALDEELRWMLPWYFQIANFCIPADRNVTRLVEYCRQNMHMERAEPLQMARWVDRGQMGDYWRSIAESNRRAV